MFTIDRLMLTAAVLLLVGVASSKFSSRLGLPVLVLFLGLGLLAGEEGIGRIAFDNYALAHAIGTVALAVILFDGGLRTSRRSFRAVLGPSIALATVGVLVTAAITGFTATWLLDISLAQGLLIGSIAASTDAAAVFAVLRGKGVNLRKRISALLEVESGSNDPMAVFLTVALLEFITGQLTTGWGLLWFLLVQSLGGVIIGIAVGRLAVYVINRVDLDAAGLYPILTGAAGMLAYGAAATLGGSGFLAVYLAGLVIGNERIVFQKGILVFHDGAAWLAQIVMFVLLGLLAFPSQLAAAAPGGLLVAAVLIFVARPLAVALVLPWFRFAPREIAFISWVGLKGAVPIVLATYPLMFGIAGAPLIFNVVFFAVLVSAVLQGWTMPPLAHVLGLQMEGSGRVPVSLEITSLRDVDGDIVEYTVFADTLASGRHVRDLRLPDSAVIAMIVRHREIIPPRGSTHLYNDDHVFVVMKPGVRPLVDRVFRRGRETPAIPTETEFPLRGDTTVADLREFYGIELTEPDAATLHDLLLERLGAERLEPGARVQLGSVALVIRELEDERVEQAGLIINTGG